MTCTGSTAAVTALPEAVALYPVNWIIETAPSGAIATATSGMIKQLRGSITYVGGARNDGPWTRFDKTVFQVDAQVAGTQPIGSLMVFWNAILGSEVDIFVEVKVRFFKRRIFDPTLLAIVSPTPLLPSAAGAESQIETQVEVSDQAATRAIRL